MITCELANRYTKVVEASTNSVSPRRIVLTGFMGSGKSTVGPLLAARLGWSFLDVDDVIEAEAGTTIAEIFARHGEAAFRKREARSTSAPGESPPIGPLEEFCLLSRCEPRPAVIICTI